MKRKLYIIVNEDRFFLSHRKDIAINALKEGWAVTIVCKDTGQRSDVESLGVKMIDLPINPTGTNIIQELKTCWFLYLLYRKNKNAVVHHVGLKTILWGGIAAKMAGVRGVVNAVSGLGVMFSEGKLSLTARGVLAVLRFSHHRKGIKVIFQNHEDEALLLTNHVTKKENVVFIKGSGVDLNMFAYVPVPNSNPIKVIFTGRMIKEKGVVVLAEAAEKLRKEYKDKVEFLLCGKLSDNPKAMSQAEIEKLCDGEYIQWLGYRTDVKELLEQSQIVAFPSYYREGVPKSLIEATAIGRPIVTCNSIGCKDTVEDGKNGYLIPIKDSNALAEKLKVLFDDYELRKRMGEESRRIAERDFSLDIVIQRHLEAYASLA